MNYLRKYTDYDYESVYGVKKKAYKEYVCQCFGIWDELEQRKQFDNFISMVKDNLYIIMYDNKKIGFYNGELLPNGNYEIGEKRL